MHIVTGAVSAAQNIIKCVRRCGLEVRDLMLQPLASATAVVSDDEKDLGVCLVDIGGGTTDIAIFTHGAIRHTGGDPDRRRPDHQRHRDGAAHADQGRRGHQAALRLRAAQLADPQQMIEVPGVGDRGPRQLSRQTLAEVIEPRVEELYSLVQSELRRCGYEELLSSGIVITGGSSSMQGMVELGEEIFHMPVRVGLPQYHGALVGSGAQSALRHGRRSADGWARSSSASSSSRRRTSGRSQRLFERMKNWFKGNF